MTQLYIGLISGTSADGIDAALLETSGERLRVLHAHTTPYPESLREHVLALARAAQLIPEDLGQTDRVLGRSFANAALALLGDAGLQAGEISAIGMHGQTIRHRPDLQEPFTWQIGDPNQVAALTGITTVADFRRRDMALGGQGAPLVPAFHRAAFASANETRAVLNLGGIANLTVLNPANADAGFDTGPANCLLDQHAARHDQGRFDSDGSWAAQGQVCKPLLEQLLSDPYFALPPPKSTGPEYFNLEWLAAHQQAGEFGASGADLQATLAELTVQSAASAVRQHAPDARLLIICGGGVHNTDLVNRLARALPGMQISNASLLGIDADYVEAAAFAWLAQRTLAGLPGNVPGATGASGPAVLGAIYPA